MDTCSRWEGAGRGVERHLGDSVERGVSGTGGGGLGGPLEGVLAGLLHVALAPSRVAARARGSRHARPRRLPHSRRAAGRLDGGRLGPPRARARAAQRCRSSSRAICGACRSALPALTLHPCTQAHSISIVAKYRGECKAVRARLLTVSLR